MARKHGESAENSACADSQRGHRMTKVDFEFQRSGGKNRIAVLVDGKNVGHLEFVPLSEDVFQRKPASFPVPVFPYMGDLGPTELDFEALANEYWKRILPDLVGKKRAAVLLKSWKKTSDLARKYPGKFGVKKKSRR